MKRKAGTLVLWSAFLALDLILAGVVCEIWIRTFIPIKNICYVSDPKIGARFCPNQKTYGYVEPGYKNILTTNSLGFHDVERARTKPEGTYRIQVYGDSMIQGYCVDLKHTIPSLLEKELGSRRFPSKIEVMNLAPGDDSTSSEVVTYQEVGRSFNPDLVICYFMDDFHDNVIQIHGRRYSPYHRIGKNRELIYIPPVPKDTSTLWERFKANSRFYRLMANKVLESKFYYDFMKIKNRTLTRIKSFFGAGDARAGTDYLQYRRNVCINESWPLTLRLIKFFKDIVEKNGARFILVDGEVFDDANVGTVYSNKDLEVYCRENGIEYIPAYKRYSKLESSQNPERYFFRDHHLTTLGNEVMSAYLADAIEPDLIADINNKTTRKGLSLSNTANEARKNGS